MDNFLTVDDVANAFKVRRETVKRWIDEGKIKAVRIGRNYRITAESFAEALRPGKREKRTEAGKKDV